MNWYLDVLKKYAVFNGRARRTEFWMFTLFNLIASFVVYFIGRVIGFPLLSSLYSLAVLLPTIAVSARRLHDTGRTGWLTLLWLIPCIGWIVLLVFWIGDSQPGDNEHGPNPKLVAGPAV
ncbi:DUF805 domain-containing protein [Streptomyces sp. MI02-7b]|uniref:DUF805 domain-containing protein n=1 Tax=Streptomyces sp. MI02-7b TaxID=462941 RepID=UPI0029BDB3E4|nr:DUF805 domain-containing protein [Streptomyces sp. MI02-7b]MDX3070937.1 DUF805 domain-containing protein [Streptomyces sp. MI02-7b]